ncbi:MAG: hypothetical protein JWN47_1212 [Frankiales bacterium]|nr:hypothetical protein [Frankiales bacterium]
MTLIKVVLVLSFLGLVVWAFRNRGRVGLRAGTRLLALILTAAAITSVLQPDIAQRAANVLGVTRGTDLVLYGLTVVFVLTSVGTYFRFREQDRRLVEIVRSGAIRDSILSEGMPGSKNADTQTGQE